MLLLHGCNLCLQHVHRLQVLRVQPARRRWLWQQLARRGWHAMVLSRHAMGLSRHHSHHALRDQALQLWALARGVLACCCSYWR